MSGQSSTHYILSRYTKEPICCYKYTALGDSIAFGVGATNDYGYVDYFGDFLASMHRCVRQENLAVPGFTSTNLLNQLRTDEKARKAVKKARVITISIGGANLLNCFIDVQTVTPTWIEAGVTAFTHDWPRILKEIRNVIGSEARILVMNVHNPFKGNDPLHNFAEHYIEQINVIIGNHDFVSLYEYRVVDVHKAFQGVFVSGTWKVCVWTHNCQQRPNPHPTNRGHTEIARLHEAAYCHKHHYRHDDK